MTYRDVDGTPLNIGDVVLVRHREDQGPTGFVFKARVVRFSAEYVFVTSTDGSREYDNARKWYHNVKKFADEDLTVDVDL